MGLVAELWGMFLTLRGSRLSRGLRFSGGMGAVLLVGRLCLSPFATPLSVCSIMLTAPLHRATTTVGPESDGRDAIFVTAPDYFAVKLVQLARRIDEQPLPRRFRALSFGPQRVVMRRTGDRTLGLDYEGGILSTPFMELYRDRRLRMAPGDRVTLEGLSIEVRRVTADGRVDQAEFTFDRPLEEPSLRFYYWTDGGFAPLSPPPVGEERVLPGAAMRWGLR